MKDLIVLVADKNMDFAVRGILSKIESLEIRKVDYAIIHHAGRGDGGVRTTGPETLALMAKKYAHAILMLDWDGSGSDANDAVVLEQELDLRLSKSWGRHAKAIVIDPEVDIWIWGSDNALSTILGWTAPKGIRAWLQDRGFEFSERQKPVRPKEALEIIMFELDEPRSSKLYEKVTKQISLSKCQDPAFLRLKTILQTWFPSATT